MRIFLLAVVIILISSNQSASGAPTKIGAINDTPRLQRVYDEKYGVMCYFPLKQGTDIPVLEGMSCVVVNEERN
jgi:hypothetical protein